MSCLYAKLGYSDFQPYINSLDQYLENKGCSNIEGHMCSISSDQPAFFSDLIKSNPKIIRIAEIGFNAGHSSAVFLQAKPNVIVYSFDIMNHRYVRYGKEFIDQTFPDRHVLIEGDSTKSVPRFYQENPSVKFDLIFIDGGHGYNFVFQDIKNMRNFAHRDTIVILDDAFPNMDPDKASKVCEKMGILKRGKYYISGHNPCDWPRAWRVCKYVFKPGL